MTYGEIINQLYGRGRFGMRPGLTRIRKILKAMDNPQDGLKIIHVAGTNGKGSTAAFLASILESGGYKVGLFTSPHLIAFPERIRVNGKEISETDVISAFERIMSKAPPDATFFEIITAMAVLSFAENGVGPAVMEVGMGGRFDATNAANGILSVITPVSLDHCDYLGEDIAEIARQKAGVIKHGKPVISARQSQEAASAIAGRCRRLGCAVYREGADFEARWTGSGMEYRGPDWRFDGLRPGIPGIYQVINAAAALCAAEVLHMGPLPLPEHAAREGLERARWPGRMELFKGSPSFLLDGAHNPSGARALAEALAEIPRKTMVIIVGVVGDKDIEGILSPLLPLADMVITASPAVPRGLPSPKLAEICGEMGYPASAAGSVPAGMEKALKNAGAGDLVVIYGSLFVVGEARALLTGKIFESFRG
jgi:dihydrofolate synthase / folylpolyglutamate synthase